MNLWQGREQSLEWLNTELSEQQALIQNGFALLDRCIALLNRRSAESKDELDGRFARVANLTLAKTRNLLLGSYSMMLDAIAQEAGALLRLILEGYELLIYFRLEPSRVDQAIEGKLPNPGQIAKKIGGEFRGLRDYLNSNASHLSFSFESSRHLVDYQTFEIKAIQNQTVDVLKTNLTTLNGVQVLITVEAVRCLSTLGFNSDELNEEYEQWRRKCIAAAPPPATKA